MCSLPRAAVKLTQWGHGRTRQDTAGQASRGQGFLSPPLRKLSAKHDLRGLITSGKYLAAANVMLELSSSDIWSEWGKNSLLLLPHSPLSSPDFPPQLLTKIGMSRMWGKRVTAPDTGPGTTVQWCDIQNVSLSVLIVLNWYSIIINYTLMIFDYFILRMKTF